MEEAEGNVVAMSWLVPAADVETDVDTDAWVIGEEDDEELDCVCEADPEVPG